MNFVTLYIEHLTLAGYSESIIKNYTSYLGEFLTFKEAHYSFCPFDQNQLRGFCSMSYKIPNPPNQKNNLKTPKWQFKKNIYHRLV